MKALAPTLFLAISLVAGTTFSGCAGMRAKPGVDGTAYSLGHLDVVVSADPKRIVTAAQGVLEDMDIPIERAEASGVDGQVIGRTTLGKRIEITVERLDAETSKYSIVIGSFGDEPLSREIHEKMKAKL